MDHYNVYKIQIQIYLNYKNYYQTHKNKLKFFQ